MEHGESSLIHDVDIQVDMCVFVLGYVFVVRPFHVHLGEE